MVWLDVIAMAIVMFAIIVIVTNERPPTPPGPRLG